MRNILLITKREYLTQVKKKSFVLLTLLAPLMIVGFGVLISFMMKANETHTTIDVVDKSHIFTRELKSDELITYRFVDENQEQTLAKELAKSETSDGLLLIPSKKEEQNVDEFAQNIQFLINSSIGADAKDKVIGSVNEILRKEKVKALGLTQEQISSVDANVSIKTINVSENKEDSDLQNSIKIALSFLLVYATFMFIVIYGVRVMRSVLEEKNNRVVEILISSVKPFHLMMGKILGVTLVALTQFSIWIIMTVSAAVFLNAGFASVKTKMPQGMNSNLPEMDFEVMATEISHHLLEMNFPLIIAVFILFFLLGYLFYSSIYAAVGSAVDNETETQQFTMFAILPLMLGMYGSFTIITNPEGPLGFWLSIIPFTSPVAMIARIPFGVPMWQIGLALLLLILSTLAMIYIAGKIYRVGILTYGNKASLKEIWKWIKY